MDKATVKIVLGAFRANRQDEADPVFAEALREVQSDPELAAWFADEQRFDAWVTRSLQQVTAPAGLKELILLNAHSPANPSPAAAPFSLRWKQHLPASLATAACLALAFVLGRQTSPRVVPASTTETNLRTGSDPLALQAIDYTDKMPALQFVCFDASVVARWVTEKSASMNMGKLLDKPLASMQMIGSSAAEWEGKPVIMVALQNKDQMAMLYLVRASDFPGVAGNGEITEKGGWVSKTGRNGEHLYVLTTKGTRANLNFPMPL